MRYSTKANIAIDHSDSVLTNLSVLSLLLTFEIFLTAAPCDYVVEEQLTQGSLGENSKLGPVGTIVNTRLDPLDDVAPNQKFHSVEVFYDYGPNVMTFVGTNMNKLFYDRTIFTNVSAIN